jgi:hypothetical protein
MLEKREAESEGIEDCWHGNGRLRRGRERSVLFINIRARLL